MKIKVEVEIYGGFGRKSVEVEIDEAELREVAENKVMKGYQCDSCQAKGVEIVVQV